MENEDELDPSAPVQTSAQSGVISSGSGAPGGSTQAPKASTPDRTSNFVGITDYLKSNKTQAGKLGDQASGVITNSANDARNSVNDLNNQFNQQAGQAVELDQNALGKVNQAETLNDQEKQKLKSQYNAQYQGPSGLQDLNDQYAAANQKLNTAKTNVQAAGTEQGRKGLITQINEKPRTAGINNFDNVLLSAGGGREKVEQAAQSNQDVTGDVLGAANTAAQQKAAQIKAQNDATRAATQQAVQGSQGALVKAIQDRMKSYQDSTAAQNNKIAQDLGDNAYSLDADTLAAFGLLAGDRSYGLDPNAYFTQGDISKIDEGNAAEREEYLRSQALADIAGGSSYLDQANIDKAGTAKNYAPKIDADRFAQDRLEKDMAYTMNRALRKTQRQILS